MLKIIIVLAALLLMACGGPSKSGSEDTEEDEDAALVSVQNGRECQEEPMFSDACPYNLPRLRFCRSLDGGSACPADAKQAEWDPGINAAWCCSR